MASSASSKSGFRFRPASKSTESGSETASRRAEERSASTEAAERAAGGREAASTDVHWQAQLWSLRTAAPKGVVCREGEMPPTASTSRLPADPSTMGAYLSTDFRARSRSATASPSKGKGKEVTTSLLNRMSGPSDQKAGLGKRDPEEVKAIIYEASKGSKFFQNEQRKDEELTKKVDALLKDLEKKVGDRRGDLNAEEARADALVRELEKERDLSQTIMVVDADAFYASVEELYDPSLKGTAFCVGQGIVTTASYEARKFGCRSAMPSFIAEKLCPGLKSLPLDFTRYTKCSKEIMAVLAEYDPLMSPASLDEAYLSIGPYCQREGITPAEAGNRIREHVKRETGLTVSAGIAPNALLAKIAADFNKPDGQYVIPPTREACMAFMAPLAIRKVPGIGRVTERWLTALGVNMVADVHTLRGKLFLVRESVGLRFLMWAHLGCGQTSVEKSKREDRKSVSREDTFSSTMWKREDLYGKLREMAEALAKDLEKLKYSGRTVNLRLKLDTYEVLSRACTIGSNRYICKFDDLYAEGKKLLDKEIANRAAAFDTGRPVKGSNGRRELCLRLLGIKLSNLRDDEVPEQDDAKKEKSLDGFVKTKRAADSKESSRPAKKQKRSAGEPEVICIDDSSDDEDVEPESRDGGRVEDEEDDSGSHELARGRGVDVDEADVEWSDWDPTPQGGEIAAALDSLQRDPGEAAGYQEGAEEEVEDYKPFFTGGPSMNSTKRVKMAATVPEEDRLNLDQSDENERECPVCEKRFVGSAEALNGHVNLCLSRGLKKKLAKKKDKTSSSKPAPKKQRSPEAARFTSFFAKPAQ